MYQITNKVNNKIYVGVHKTESLDDGYMGSGSIIRRAIDKHGISNFEKVILEHFDNSEAMYAKEKEVVDESFLERDDVYNLRRGGQGGFDYINKNGLNIITKEHPNFVAGLANKLKSNKEFAINFSKTCSHRNKLQYTSGKRRPSGCCVGQGLKDAQERSQSIEARTKRKATLAERRPHDGEKNSQFGVKRIGVYFEDLIRKILPEELDMYLQYGWSLGFKPKIEKKITVKVSNRNWSDVVCKSCGIVFEASQRDIRRGRKYCKISCR